jgi:DNA-binding MarR family transcriptional regulator
MGAVKDEGHERDFRQGHASSQGADADVESVIRASRALLGVIATSVAEALETVTLPQFRVLVVLASSGPLPIGAVAARVNAVPSTFSRFLDRMEEAGLVARGPSPDSRREILVRLADDGARIVHEATQRRRESMAEILGRLDSRERKALVTALDAFSAAAGEPSPETLLTMGL